MVRVRAVTPREDFQVQLVFVDGTQKTVDLAPFLRGPIFEPMRRDPAQFRRVTVDEELGTIVWPNGADVDPDVLYAGLTPAWAEPESSSTDKASA